MKPDVIEIGETAGAECINQESVQWALRRVCSLSWLENSVDIGHCGPVKSAKHSSFEERIDGAPNYIYDSAKRATPNWHNHRLKT